VTVAVDLANKGERFERLPVAVEEWMSEHTWASDVFDANGWNWYYFVLAVERVFKEHTATWP
jgi:hypothetical protein